MISKEKLDEINRLKQEIDSHGKLPADVLKKINYKLRLEWNYTSNSMEGNTLTRDETRSVMVGNIDVHDKPIKDLLEMKGHDDVISKIMEIGKGQLNLSEGRIREIHKGIMHEEDPAKAKMIGEWKLKYNIIYTNKGEKIDFAPPGEVPERMHELINWLNTEKEKIEHTDKNALHPAEIAFKFHLVYVTIHPFYDGNGRTARIFTNLILIAYGYPPIYIKTSEKDTYGNYLGDIQGYGGNPDLFYDFMAGLLIRSLQLTLDAIEGKEIGELDDVDKEIELLKREFKVIDYEKIKKSVEVVSHLFVNTLIPFFETIQREIGTFNEHFMEHRFRLKPSEMSVSSISLERENAIDKIQETILEHYPSNRVELHFEWFGFRHNREEPEVISVDFIICLEDFYYVLNCQQPSLLKLLNKYQNKDDAIHKRTEIKKFYKEPILPKEQKMLISELKKEVLEKIKKISKDDN